MSATKLSSQNADQAAFDAALSHVVELDGVMIERGGRILFRNVNFALARAGVVQLCGANGCGKTSLLRALAGALPVSQGRVSIAPDADFSFLPADDALWQGQLLVRDALNDWAAVLGVAAARVDDVLARMGLAAIALRPLAMLSMGQKRRLSWARLLLRPASLWLLDEPLNSLDRDGTETVAQLMREHLQSGGAMVIACHDDIAPVLGGMAPLRLELGGGGA